MPPCPLQTPRRGRIGSMHDAPCPRRRYELQMRHDIVWDGVSDLARTEEKVATSVPCRLDVLTGMVVLRHTAPLSGKGGIGTMSVLDGTTGYVVNVRTFRNLSVWDDTRRGPISTEKASSYVAVRTDDVRSSYAIGARRAGTFRAGIDHGQRNSTRTMSRIRHLHLWSH